MLSTLRSLAAYSAAGLLLACSDGGSGTAIVDAHTLIAVNPADFPHTSAVVDAREVSFCSGPNSQGAYVAELLDVSGVLETDSKKVSIQDFPVQSSPPTACSRTVAFARVVEHREYVARVWTYADTDGDPNTIDVCTIDGTSVTVTLVGGACTTTPAIPVAQLKCYGWQRPSLQQNVAPNSEESTPESAAQAGAMGQPLTASNSSASCDERGCAGVAVGYRTMTLHYCVVESDR